MATTLSPLDALRDQIEQLGGDPSLSVESRDALLGALGDELMTLLGRLDSYRAEGAKRAEAAGEDLLSEAYENAELREELIRREVASAEECDQLGLISREEVDRLQEEELIQEALPMLIARARQPYLGEELIEEAAWGLAKNFREFLVKRSRGGQFVRKSLGRKDPGTGGGGGLNENHAGYFTRHDTTLPVSRLKLSKPAKDQPDSVDRAEEFMRQAEGGSVPRREPVLVKREGSHYRVVDGNATTAVAMRSGWKSIPVRVIGGDGTARDVLVRMKAAKADGIEPKQDQKAKTWDALLESTKKGMPEFSALVEQIGKDVGVQAGKYEDLDERGGSFIGPLKKKKRADEKVFGDYGGDWTKLNDVGRATVAVPTAMELPDALEAAKARAKELGWSVTNLKDRYTSGGQFSKGETLEQYADLSMLLRSPDGVNFELQINTAGMIAAKEKAHKLYERSRVLEQKKVADGLTPAEAQELSKLQREQVDLYEEGREASLPVRDYVGGNIRPGLRESEEADTVGDMTTEETQTEGAEETTEETPVETPADPTPVDDAAEESAPAEESAESDEDEGGSDEGDDSDEE